jgi:hypothetical protein
MTRGEASLSSNGYHRSLCKIPKGRFCYESRTGCDTVRAYQARPPLRSGPESVSQPASRAQLRGSSFEYCFGLRVVLTGFVKAADAEPSKSCSLRPEGTAVARTRLKTTCFSAL